MLQLTRSTLRCPDGVWRYTKGLAFEGAAHLDGYRRLSQAHVALCDERQQFKEQHGHACVILCSALRRAMPVVLRRRRGEWHVK
jgi:hypothetical protein